MKIHSFQRRMRRVLEVATAFTFACIAVRTAHAEVVVYSGDLRTTSDNPSGLVYNVKTWSTSAANKAVGDGTTDDAPAIQSAINHILARKGVGGGNMGDSNPDNDNVKGADFDRHFTLYFPAGTYLLRSRLTLGSAIVDINGVDNGFQRNLHVKGAGQTVSKLKLKDEWWRTDNNDSTDDTDPITVFSFQDDDANNDAFANTIEDLTIDTGIGNPQATALRFHNNNLGYVRRVTLTTGGNPAGSQPGNVGLELGVNLAGIGLVSEVTVNGFDYGIRNGGGYKIAYVLENVTLNNQQIAGILNVDKGISIRRLTSNQSKAGVPALRQDSGGGDNALTVIVGSTLRGSGEAALDIRDGWVLARGIDEGGYTYSVKSQRLSLQRIKFPDAQSEYVTDNKVYKVNDPGPPWADVPDKTLNLMIEPTEAAYGLPATIASNSTIAVVDTAASNDDTANIQAAINSGKPIVFLKRGSFKISGTIVLKSTLRRFYGNWAELDTTDSFVASNNPLFKVEGGSANLAIDTLYALKSKMFLRNESSRTLIIRDLHAACEKAYLNTAAGNVFIENVFTTNGALPQNILDTPGPGWDFNNQNVWARSINHEGSAPHFKNTGGKLWILGFKAGEGRGTYLFTGAGGETEALGGVFNHIGYNQQETYYSPTIAAIGVYGGGKASISALSTADVTVQKVALEDRGEVKRLGVSSVPQRDDGDGGYVLPLFRAGSGPGTGMRTAQSSALAPTSAESAGTGEASGGQDTQHGLTGRYFSDGGLTTLVMKRVDPRVDFDWGRRAAMSSVGPRGFSVRWTGQVQALEGGLYTFVTQTDDGVRLWLDNKPVPIIDDWSSGGYRERKSRGIALQAGRKYAIKMEFYQVGEQAKARLSWQRPGSTRVEIIPQRQLTPEAPDAR